MDKESLWQSSLSALQISVSPANFKTWFQDTRITRIDNKLVEIACPSVYAKQWLEERYRGQISKVLEEVGGNKFEIVFTISSTLKKPLKRVSEEAPLFDSGEEEKTRIHKRLAESRLNPKHTLENFVIGKNNQLAYAVAQAIISSPGKVYNPFFLYGGVGVGKTHLIQAIGQALLKESPTKTVVYCTGEAFTNEMVEAIQNRRNSAFRNKYREVDLLLIDDIQFIAGREGTQEEFFHTFNALHGAGRQVVMTSDRPPKDIAKLEERLRSRFEWGMITDIQPPDKDMRVAIISFKCRELGIELPFEVANLLAERVNSVRDLEGALMRLTTTAQLTNQPVSVDLVRLVMGIQNDSARRQVVNPKEVIEVVAQEFNVKPSEIRGARRYKEIVVPRQICMYILRNDFNLPLTRVAEMLGGRDHTTVMYGVSKCEKLIKNDVIFKEQVGTIMDRLTNG